jgi:hypothetical protein
VGIEVPDAAGAAGGMRRDAREVVRQQRDVISDVRFDVVEIGYGPASGTASPAPESDGAD